MTINLSDNTPRVSYDVADGVTQSSFTVSFEFYDEADLNVYVDGTLKTLTTDYTVTGGDGATGSITMSVTGASGGSTVVITREIDLKRTTDFPASGAFKINSLNTELDKLIAIAADIDDEVGRSLRLTDYDVAANLTLPELDTRKGTVLAFNTTTGAVEAGPKTTNVNTLADISDDIATLADIEDGTDATDAIQTVAGISGNVTTVSGISSDVTSVANISSNVTSVASDEADIGTVATSIANVNTVAGIDSDVTTVAGISANVTTVAGDSTDIQALAAKTTELGLLGVADVISDMNTLATSAIVTDMDALADLQTEIDALGDVTADISTVAGIESDVTTVSGISANTTTVAGISANVTTVAGVSSDVTTVAGISANTTTVAGISSDVTTVAGVSSNVTTVAGISSNVTTVAGDSADIQTVADNITGINSFAERYRVGATDPTTSLDEGDLFFNTTDNGYKFYDGSAWQTVNVSGIGSVAEDTTPQLGGDLDVAGQSIVSASNGDIAITPNGTGNVVIDGLNHPQADGSAGQFLKTDGAGQLAFATVNTDLSNDTSPQLGGVLDTNSNNIEFGDNVKAVFGTDDDMEVYHSGSHGFIENKGTGSLRIRNSTDDFDVLIESDDGSGGLTTYIQADGSIGAVKLNHYGSEKLRTTSTGISVTGSVTSSSDLRLKDNVETITDAMDKVNGIDGVTFDWADGTGPSAGVIAQQVLAVLPQSVDTSDADHLKVNYDSLIGLLIEAIKEQDKRIKSLEDK